MVDFSFNDVLTVHPTEFNFPLESKEKKKSYSIQLTNTTDQLVAYHFSRSSQLLAPPTMGTIIPHSTCTVTVGVMKPRPEDRQDCRRWIGIHAYIVNDCVKSEGITRENLGHKAKCARDYFELPVVYTRVNSCSAVPENLLPKCINNKVHGSTSKDNSQSSNEISIKLFYDDEIRVATNSLSDSSKIGQGGYGAVYKGTLHGTEVAIKILDPNSEQGIHEFFQEMDVLGRTRHPNLVKLIGACLKLRALVYEFLPHGSLGDCLRKNPMLLTWQKRTRIVFEICSALTFLHSVKPQPVVHGDLKPANILLDANYVSKITDFGLCRFMPEGTTNAAFLVTKPKGTFDYIDPEFMKTGILTPGCDVYSFGVTILRLLTGMDASGIYTPVLSAYKEKSLMEIVDTTAGHWPADVSELLAYFGLKCCATKKSPGLMKEIVGDLEIILARIGG